MDTHCHTRVFEGSSSSYWLDAFDADVAAAAPTTNFMDIEYSRGPVPDSVELSFDGPVDTATDILKQPDNAAFENRDGVDADCFRTRGARPRLDFEPEQEEMQPKKPRVIECKTNRNFSSRDRCLPAAKDRSFNKRRQRDFRDDHGREHIGKRREYQNIGRRDYRERDRREARGYWERDRSGSNELVFRQGSWKADYNKDGMSVKDNTIRSKCDLEKKLELPNGGTFKTNGGQGTKSEGLKRKVPEEKARQYQLDVLEQARAKNTIAFLETGAGKTLIAVLLIKSINDDLKKLNKKMLAVFLVPKVPLVYQVFLYFVILKHVRQMFLSIKLIGSG